MNKNVVIGCKNLTKVYPMYSNPRDRFKEALHPFRKKFHKEFYAINNVSFEIYKGDCVGVIGKNGAGKSTLLKMITGVLTPTSGSINVKGKIASLLELGAGFNTEMTGIENIYLNGTIMGFSKEEIKEKIKDITSFADIGEHINQPVKSYSSGMFARLAFAVAINVEPDILIVDEGLSVGDALFQKKCFDRVNKLIDSGETTFLFVSHDKESMHTLTEKCLFLEKGASIFYGHSSKALLMYQEKSQIEELQYIKNEMSDLDSKKNDISSEKLDNLSSFGSRRMEIVSVETLDINGDACGIFYPGDTIKIKVSIDSHDSMDKLNIGLRIRSKEGNKIYSFGSLNQDSLANKSLHFKDEKIENTHTIWTQTFKKNQKYCVDFDFICNLGQNMYEIQSIVSLERTPDYKNQQVLHWVNEAAFFYVKMKSDSIAFGGMFDLRASVNAYKEL